LAVLKVVNLLSKAGCISEAGKMANYILLFLLCVCSRLMSHLHLNSQTHIHKYVYHEWKGWKLCDLPGLLRTTQMWSNIAHDTYRMNRLFPGTYEFSYPNVCVSTSLNQKQECAFEAVWSAGVLECFGIHQVWQCYIIVRSSLYIYHIIMPLQLICIFSKIALFFLKIMSKYIFILQCRTESYLKPQYWKLPLITWHCKKEITLWCMEF